MAYSLGAWGHSPPPTAVFVRVYDFNISAHCTVILSSRCNRREILCLIVIELIPLRLNILQLLTMEFNNSILFPLAFMALLTHSKLLNRQNKDIKKLKCPRRLHLYYAHDTRVSIDLLLLYMRILWWMARFPATIMYSEWTSHWILTKRME